jgi:hypothetical protein
VALHRDGRFICGATIISRQWIATAGHCLYEFDTKKYQFQVRLHIFSFRRLPYTQKLFPVPCPRGVVEVAYASGTIDVGLNPARV